MSIGTAPGYRHNLTGTQDNVGRNSCCWSSGVSGSTGRFLWFDMQGLGTSGTANRAFGLPLRCLSE
ncbi:hypothetical protein [uncultured Rikenella sp.]|uniref:hypothetical protein n=1 Tax=uncultured Rikenella sp. TaxID=368003 RepID=UPI0026129C21|nr:hypothetical protein [uncultured Rikenella sp.]